MDARRRRILRGIDGVLTVVLLAVAGAFALLMVLLGRAVGMVVDSCGDPGFRCSGALIDAGMITTTFAPLLVAVVVLIAVLALRRRRRWTSPLALLGAAAVYGAAALGQALAAAGVLRS
jgi:uncharacterized BrkB/YihY/UPF0761 family membrane protein